MLLILFFGSTWMACKDDDEVKPVGFTVTVSYPETYKDQLASGAKVIVTNTVTNVTENTTTNASGAAMFSTLIPGTYQISVSRDLSASEGLTQTGIESEVYLNASVSNYVLSEAGGNVDVRLKGSPVGGLVLKEIYYTGSPSFYFYDQFYEIYNNSTDTLYADSLCIGDVVGNPYLSSSSKPSGFLTDTENIYFSNIWMVPGNGKTYPIAPGKSIIIAETGMNHKSDPAGNPESPVDLGTPVGDFETYYETSGRDTDNPAVPNMIQVYIAIPTMFDWLTTVFGPSIAIFRHPDPAGLPLFTEPGSTSTRSYPQVPVANVIDAVDAVSNENASAFKRLPAALDAGFTYCSGTYVKESVRRKVKATLNGRRVLQDTNNSTQDFEVLTTPTPKSW